MCPSVASAALASLHCDNAICPQVSKKGRPGAYTSTMAIVHSTCSSRDSNLPKVTQLVSGTEARVCLLGPRLSAIVPFSPDGAGVAKEAL